MNARALVAMLVVCGCGAVCAQEKALVDKNVAPPAKQTSGYEISGTLLNAMTGEPLPKAKVWVVPVLDPDQQDDETPTGGRGTRGAGGPGGGGQGPGGGGRFAGGGGPGGGRAFAQNRGQRGQGQQQGEVEPTTEAFTDANGRFDIEDVRPGKYTMYAERKGFPRQALERHGGFNTAVVVGEGKDTSNIVFRAVPDSGISGRITDDFGDPVPNARVFLFYKSSAETGEEGIRRRGTTGTDTQGNYHFSHLPPATYYVVVSAQPWYAMYSRMMGMSQMPDGTGPPEGDANLDVAFGVTYFSNSYDENNATPIPLNAGEHFQADMMMNTTQAMHIQVAGVDPKAPIFPMLTAQVFGTDVPLMPMPMMMRPPGADGNPPVMGLVVAPGQYRADMRSFNGNGGPPTAMRRQTVDTAGGGVILDVNKGEEPAHIAGTVTFEGTTDTPRGSVFFRRVDGVESTGGIGGRSDGDGQFTAEIFPGKYNIVANFSHYVIKSMSATGAKVSGRTLEIATAQPVKFNLVMSKDDARIDGVVQGGDEKPVAGAFVILVPDDMANNEPLFRRSQTGTDGSFHFGQVIPGKYTVVAVQNNWNLEWAKPNVMQPYLAKGDAIEVTAKAAMKLKVKMQ